MRDFKISRIEEYKNIRKRNSKNKDFSLENYMKDCFGIFKDEKISIKLEIKYPLAQIVKGKNLG